MKPVLQHGLTYPVRYIFCAALSIVALCAVLRADEIRLKDGSKIVGNVVGVEGGAFKIETAYGFAMVRKDSIAEIVPTAEPKTGTSKSAASKPADTSPVTKPTSSADVTAVPSSATSEAKPQNAPGKLVETAEPKPQSAKPKPAAYTGAKTQPASSAGAIPPAAKQLNVQPIIPATGESKTLTANSPASTSAQVPASTAKPATSPTAVPPAATAVSAVPPAPATPVAPPEPLPVREMVRGNLYINQTYGFQMYRAPDWQPISAARDALPNAIAALGTEDQSTLLIIGRDRAQEKLEAHAAATEKTVQEIFENYRPMPLQRIMIGGLPAVERQFRGLAENRDWAVTLVTLEREGAVFTILAMTDANSELVQLQMNVIAKAIGSLQFTAPTPAGPVPLPN